MTTKLETMLNGLIENLSTRHVNHAELEPIKQEILQEALKLIADATEYHKTIKDLDFDDVEAVDAWLENYPLNDFINDLLDIEDYEPLSGYLSINFFNVSGVSE